MTEIIFSKAVLPLLGAMAIEGSSIPFPGILVTLAFGSTMRPTFLESMIVALFMAIVYASASFIPYAIGRKFGVKVLSIFDNRRRIKASIEKSKDIVKKYGIVTIAISRFFGWGNKISYIAGISKIKYLPYGVLTFSGIYTWALIMLNLGKLFKGDTSKIINILEKYTIAIYLMIGIVIVVYGLIALIRYRGKTKTEK